MIGRTFDLLAHERPHRFRSRLVHVSPRGALIHSHCTWQVCTTVSMTIFPVVACTRTKSQGLTSASNPKLITHLADFSVQEVNFEHIF